MERPARAYHHGDLRAALIEAGMSLLERDGEADLGLRQVAREAGVSATAIYRHFPDKDALMRAIAARGFTLLGEMQARAASSPDRETAFAAAGAAYVRFARKHPAIFRMMFSRAPPRDLFTLPPDHLSAPLRMLREHVAGLTSSDLAEPARKLVAIRAWALVHGLATLLLDGMVEADDAMIRQVICGMPITSR